MAQLVVLAAGGIERKDNALDITDDRGVEVGEAEILFVEGGKDALEHEQLISATDFVGDGVGLEVDAFFEEADEHHGGDDDECSDDGGRIKSGTASHSDGGDDPDAGGAGKTTESVAVVEDEAGAQEADALHDVGGDLAFVACVASYDGGEDSEEGCAEADEEVGAYACGFAGEFPLEANEATEYAGKEKPAYSAVYEAHLIEPIEAGWGEDCGEMEVGYQEDFLGRC